jgi:hypothetical protein
MNELHPRKTIKCRFKSILRNDVDYTKLFTCIKKANDIYFICSNFINCYVLYCFKNNYDIPNLDEDFIRIAFTSLSKKSEKSLGPKVKGKQLKTLNNLNDFFKEEFIYLLTNNKKIDNINDYKFNSTNLTYIFKPFVIEMKTSYKNHILLNFFKYVHQFINQSFIKKEVKRYSSSEYKNLLKDEKCEYNSKISEETDKINLIRKEIQLVKSDLIDGNIGVNLKSNKKYHKWITDHRNIIFPEKEIGTESYFEDIKIDYHKYLKHMLQMNKYLEENKMKLFSSISLRTEIHDKYVTIDTSAIKDIFGQIYIKKSEKNKIKKTNEEIWKEFFNIDPKKFKIKDYSFNFQISTNGYATSINFINNDKIPEKERKILAKSIASKNSKTLRKTMTCEEIDKLNEEKKIKTKEKSKEYAKTRREEKKKKDKEFNELSKEEQNKISLEKKLKSNKYEYIEDAIKDKQLLEQFKILLKNGKIKVIDPGSNSPMTIYGDRTTDKKLLWKTIMEKEYNIPQIGKERNGKILFSYTARKRISETKRKKYGELLEHKKKKLIINENKTIKEMEQELSLYNSKTVDFDKFKEYAKLKLGMRNVVSEYNFELDKKELNELKKDMSTAIKFEKFMKLHAREPNMTAGNEYNKYVQKLKWFLYINKRRHEDKLLDEIEKVYGSDAEFVIGDWSNRGNLRKISMPNSGMKKLLSKRFKVWLVDEYRTSMLNHITEEKMENLKKKIRYEKDGKEKTYTKKIHSILTFQMGRGRGCINRDYNACRNMYKIVEKLLSGEGRPINFCRTTRPEEIKKLATICARNKVARMRETTNSALKNACI